MGPLTRSILEAQANGQYSASRARCTTSRCPSKSTGAVGADTGPEKRHPGGPAAPAGVATAGAGGRIAGPAAATAVEGSAGDHFRHAAVGRQRPQQPCAARAEKWRIGDGGDRAEAEATCASTYLLEDCIRGWTNES